MDNNSKRIAFTGPFADVNFGDYAMLVNNIYDLNIKRVTLFSYDNDFLSKIKNDYLSDYETDIIAVKLNEKPNFESNYCYTPIEILNMISNYSELVDKIQEIDVLIVNGGGYFNSLWSMPHRIKKLIKIIAPILIANQLNKKIVFTGNGYGPYLDDKSLFESIFSSLRNVTFGSRDNLYSPIWAKDAGVKSDEIEIIPDDLLLINSNILNQPKTISLNFEKYIVMETYLPVEFIKKNISHFIDFSSTIYSRYGLNIIFLPLNLEQGGMQQAVFLNKHLEHYQYIDITQKGYLPIQDAVHIIKNAELVVSTRYHALVIALGTETPIIGSLREVIGDKRYYYNKNSGMLRLALHDTEFNEQFYLGTDYLKSLEFIKSNFNQIVEYQKKVFNSQYKRNMINLKDTRNKYLINIKKHL